MLSESETIYHIPLNRLSTYRHGYWILRTGEPATLAATLAEEDPERLVAVQLWNLEADSESLNPWAPGLPIELVLQDPASQYPSLYRHTNLLDHHPVLAIVPVQPGFLKAVKVAISLDFGVRLAIGQPDPALIEELLAALDFYLYQPSVDQPIEFFHGTLLGFYHDQPLSLWTLLGEEPQALRFVSADGVESGYGRLASADFALAMEPALDLDLLIDQTLATAPECRDCEFLRSCGGYFKWPVSDYDCTGIKRLFGQLRTAALDLRRDLAAARA